MRYERLSSWLDWQEKLHPTQVDMELERVRTIADNCGLLSPKPVIITIAGTNGKGSTIAMLESIFQAQGYHVASYTSPHIHRYNERIRIDGNQVEDHELCKAFDFIDRRRYSISLSFFEFCTLAALYCFSQYEAKFKLDVILLEVGLGGRLDAVNIIDPTVSIITSIGIDHTEWLGRSRESIAIEKSGIMRADTPVICGDFEPPSTLIQAAKEKQAILYQQGVDFSYICNDKSYYFKVKDEIIGNLPQPALFGAAQLQNAASALMALHCLHDRLPVEHNSIVSGLQGVNLQGRFQIERGEKTRIFDIAHNPDSARSLADNLTKTPCSGLTHAVFGVLADKDVHSILSIMSSVIDVWHFAEPNNSRALRVDVLEEMAKKSITNISAYSYISVYDAYHAALDKIVKEDRVVIFGSMAVVAEALPTSI